ncbi:MAG: LysR family transcriptional regulator, partial [Pseudomonadota bacterium]
MDLSNYLILMSLPSKYLDAFQEIAKSGGFSQATEVLHVSQSALSQRIKNLEEEMGLTLFVRTPSGVILTEQGERLLRYCQTRDSLEEELVQELNASNSFEVAGTVRIGSYSSVFRSVVVPALSPLLKKYPNILCEFSCAEVRELPGMLQRAEVDFVIMDYRLDQANLETEVLGQEKFVVIKSKSFSSRNEIFLDNDRNDKATESFFISQKKRAFKYRRSYFGDCYGIIDGVKAGLGRAIMSEHLISGDKSLQIADEYKPYRRDVVLHYYKQPFYSRLSQIVVDTLKRESKAYLC